MKRRRLTLLRDAALALTSLAVGLAACELALRRLHPRYEFAASPPPSAQDREGALYYTLVSNPDTGVRHRLSYNELGARTSRRFTAESLSESVNLAFFGDSKTENIHIPVQYAFTEHLHFLLNHLGPAGSTTRQPLQDESRFNVLNFGLFGAGIARAYLYWQRVSAKSTFDHVFYFFNGNDFPDLQLEIARGYVQLDESGNVRLADFYAPPPPWKRLIAHWHLTYLAIDAWKRLASPSPTADGRERSNNGDKRLALQETGAAFRKVVLMWKREVEAHGGRFHMAVGPRASEGLFAEAGLSAFYDELDPFDLLACFNNEHPDWKTREWRFANNPHWNPAANMVAAHCLYRYLERELDLSPRTDEALAAARHTYYQAFLDSPNWKGERFAPGAPWVSPTAPIRQADQMEGEAIVNHYLALETQPRREERDRQLVASARAAGALAVSEWSVFANIPERLLVYAKEAKVPCQEELAKPFFLHVYPFTPEKLSDSWRRHGFKNLDHGTWMHMAEDGDECVFAARLPEWPATRVRIGQFTREEDDADGKAVYNRHWEVDFAFPLARSVWDVYAPKQERTLERVLEYVKKPCAPAERQARFFLHVHPLRASDSPTSFFRPYVNLDFQWNNSADPKRGHYDAAADTCRISAVLPDFPIATIHTGQFRDGLVARRLWDVHIRLAEVERLAHERAAP